MGAGARGWRASTREAAPRPPARYVSSWIYVFGVADIAALIVDRRLGRVLGLKGPAWWHVSASGTSSTACTSGASSCSSSSWSSTCGASSSWAPGAAAGADLGDGGDRLPGLDRDGLHRLPLQQNFDSQWIATRARTGSTRSASAPSSTSWTSARCTPSTSFCSPLAVGRAGRVHVLLVRRHGVVPPYPAQRPDGADRRRPARRRIPRERARRTSRRHGPTTHASGTAPYVRYDLVKEFVIALVVIRRWPWSSRSFLVSR